MPTSPTLSVTPRAQETQAKHLRTQGIIPGILYGFGVGNRPVQCASKELRQVLRSAGESVVVELTMEGKTIPVLIHALDLDPVTNALRHVDFYAIDMTKAVKTHIPIRPTGVSFAVKDLAGVLVSVKQTILITCLPKDLPPFLTVDIGTLAKFHDTITAAELTAPAGVTILESPTEIVLTVVPPREEEVEVKPTDGGAVPVEVAAAPTEGPAAATMAGAPALEEGKKEKKK